MLDKKIKLGLLGVGHLGKIHLKCLISTNFDVVGVYDPDPATQDFVRETYGIPIFDTAEALIDASDALDIVSTTITHFELAIKAINQGKHAFIEKPICTTIEEAKALVAATRKHNVKVQIGHVERYNPAIVSLRDRKVQPKFIEGHRLTTFNTRGNDVSVILDLMIHDLDLILQLVDSEVVDVQANGVCVVNDTPDICNARITFENGCVANLTASRISMKQMRKLRMFQGNEYISLDFLNKETQIVKLEPVSNEEASNHMTIETSTGKKIINIETPEIVENNAIVDELTDFHNAIRDNRIVSVPVEAGLKALELAYLIEGKIKGEDKR
ncbi:MAG: putative dehydrogenase [Saprospiraceae bacterium]|jgi:predicted dehydrogenase|tara:strand:+ start:555 stop:1538 length:984 start_codon:yes stop_codon:yes gene_type:complete